MIEAPPRVFWEILGAQLNDFARRSNAAIAACGQPVHVTSWWRSVDRNRLVGGNQYSQHLVGLAADAVVRDEPGFVKCLAGHGLLGLAEGDHVHWQYWSAGTLRALVLGEPLPAQPRRA